MPSFIAALSRSAVPSYLILAICAAAAPFSKSSQVKMSSPRLAGTRFFQDAVKLMFDPSGRLIREPDLATVQALCLLECHEVNAQYSWTKCFRYNGITQGSFMVNVLAKSFISRTGIKDHSRDARGSQGRYSYTFNASFHQGSGCFQ
jgi:hypothetical protein